MSDTVYTNTSEIVIPFEVFRQLDFVALCKSLGMSTRKINTYLRQSVIPE